MTTNIHWAVKTYSPRPDQEELLRTIIGQASNWDVCVIEAPTAFGKTATAKALLKWAGKEKMKGTLLEPNNVLVEQVAREYSIPTIYRKNQYTCTNYKNLSCSQSRYHNKGYCKGCPYVKALRRIRAVPSTVMNYHMYMAHKLSNPLVICDEGHTTLSILQDLASKKIWQRDVGFPSNMRTVGDVRNWLQSCPGYEANFPNDELLRILNDTLESAAPSYLVEIGEQSLRGRLENVIELKPLDVKSQPAYLWPKVKKLILMSATISKVDVEELGLSQKRVLYLKAPSPIPKENRPILYQPLGSMSKDAQKANLPRLCRFIEERMKEHGSSKGLIHSTYGLNELLQKELSSNSRYLFHNSVNKLKKLEQWMESDDKILFSAGLQEGLDLHGDLCKWQIIAKVMWPSLEDNAVRYKLQQNPDWYAWQALRLVAQASGRVCRNTTDYGITYITDSSFNRLLKEHKHLFPEWFTEALITEPNV